MLLSPQNTDSTIVTSEGYTPDVSPQTAGLMKPPPDKERIGDRILRLREARRLTQEDLANRAGILQTQVAQYENWRAVPSQPTIERIARALEVPYAEFTSDADFSKPKQKKRKRSGNLLTPSGRVRYTPSHHKTDHSAGGKGEGTEPTGDAQADERSPYIPSTPEQLAHDLIRAGAWLRGLGRAIATGKIHLRLDKADAASAGRLSLNGRTRRGLHAVPPGKKP